MSSILTLMQDFCDKWGLPRPVAFVDSGDLTYRSMQAVAQEVVRDMLQYPWDQRKVRGTFTSVATELQGTIAAVFGTGFKQLVPGTFWDDTRRLPIFGPDGDTSWQILKAVQSGGPIYQYKILADGVHILPVMPAGNTLSFIYLSKYCIADSGGTGIERWSADTDYCLFPDEVFLAEFEWRWLKTRNEPWAAAYEYAYGLRAGAINNNSQMPTARLDAPTQALSPGIWVPSGNWNV